MLQERDEIPALATIADKKPKEIYEKLSDVTAVMNKGTLIILFGAPKPSLKLQSRTKPTNKKSTPSLSQLRKCLLRDVPIHAESILTYDRYRKQAASLRAENRK